MTKRWKDALILCWVGCCLPIPSGSWPRGQMPIVAVPRSMRTSGDDSTLHIRLYLLQRRENLQQRMDRVLRDLVRPTDGEERAGPPWGVVGTNGPRFEFAKKREDAEFFLSVEPGGEPDMEVAISVLDRNDDILFAGSVRPIRDALYEALEVIWRRTRDDHPH